LQEFANTKEENSNTDKSVSFASSIEHEQFDQGPQDNGSSLTTLVVAVVEFTGGIIGRNKLG